MVGLEYRLVQLYRQLIELLIVLHFSLSVSRVTYFYLHLSTYQVIVQGLRESGVFTSIIESASTPLSKDKFLSSIESSNSTRPDDTVTSSRKVGKVTDSQATVRKVLQFTDAATHEAAVPPLPSPGVVDDDDDMLDS